jgi:SAM-dependent methyltransferase
MIERRKAQFDRYAESYTDMHAQSVRMSGEEPDYFAGMKLDFVARNAALSQREPVDFLDFGCGIGGSLGHIARVAPGARIKAADISNDSVMLAKASHPNVEFGLIDDRIPFEEASVDIAMAACVFHHIEPAMRVHWASELRRVLRPGGTMFIFEHNPVNPLTRRVVSECPFDEDAILLPSRESRELLGAVGFRDVRLDYIMFFPKFLSALRPCETLLKGLPLGAQYVAYGRA